MICVIRRSAVTSSLNTVKRQRPATRVIIRYIYLPSPKMICCRNVGVTYSVYMTSCMVINRKYVVASQAACPRTRLFQQRLPIQISSRNFSGLWLSSVHPGWDPIGGCRCHFWPPSFYNIPRLLSKNGRFSPSVERKTSSLMTTRACRNIQGRP